METETALEMTWERIECKRKGSPPGLRNLANTCYLNSVIQCLTFTPPLAHFCLLNQHSSTCNLPNTGSCSFCVVEKTISGLLSSGNPIEAPVTVARSLHLFAKHFRLGRQEDAHEFLRYVIETCDDVCVKLQKPKLSNGVKPNKEPNTVIKDIFGGLLLNQVKCLSCGLESNKIDEFKDISLTIMQIDSLKNALSHFFEAEKLDGNNKYKCERCKKLSPARKQMLIRKAPNVLVIQLKRFENIYGGKIDRRVPFEENLSLCSYMCSTSQDAAPEYNLYGTVVHEGFSQDSGHYYAYIKGINSRWYCCNDTSISPVTLSEVLSEKVYVLFYLRKCQRPKEAPSNGLANSKANRFAVVQKANGTVENHKDSMKSTTCVSIRKTPDKIHEDSHSNGSISSNRPANQKVISMPTPQSDGTKIFSSSKKPSMLEWNGQGRGNHNGKENLSHSLDSDENVAGKNGCLKSQSSNGRDQNNSVVVNGITKEDANPSSSIKSTEIIVGHKRPREGIACQGEDLIASLRDTTGGMILEIQAEANGTIKHPDLDKVIQKLSSDTRNLLQSSGWCSNVKEMMRERKKVRIDQMSDIEIPIRDLLVRDVKDYFRQNFPNSVKKHLLEERISRPVGWSLQRIMLYYISFLVTVIFWR